jgi:hypothetical protein
MIISYSRAIGLFMAFILLYPSFAVAEDGQAEGAEAIYRQFATALIQGKLPQAASLADGAALRVVRRKQWKLAAGKQIAPPPVAVEVLVVAERVSEQGKQVEMSGVMLARHTIAESPELSTKIHRQNVILQHRESGWTVVYFMDNLEKCCLP